MKRENRRTHCFIDYENVHESGFEGVEALSDGDAVTIFISSVSHKISLVVLETLLRKKCELNIIHTIGTGKNNLDFQLIAEVGYQIGRHTYEAQSTQFAIISKDRGYENVVTAFLNRGFQIIQCETIEKIGHNAEVVSIDPVQNELDPEWEFAAPVRNCLISLNMSTSDMKRIDTIFRESFSLNVLHDRLVKAFGKKGNHPLYGKLKALHKQYQKTLPSIESTTYEGMLEMAESVAPGKGSSSEKQAEDEIQSPEANEDQHPEVFGVSEVLSEPLVADAEGIIEADLVTHPEKPAAEVKKKTRGRKRKQPASKPKAEHEAMSPVSPEAEAGQQVEVRAREIKADAELKSEPDALPQLVSELFPDDIQTGASAESAEKQAEKKKRRPGRPRKKNGSAKPAELQSVKEDQGIIKPVAEKD